ncbi:hypothetical protein EV182_008648, partial [Spiromyces aspiralis]
VMSALKSMPKVKHLEVAFNGMTELGFPDDFDRAIMENLEVLSLEHNSISDANQVAHLAQLST